MIVLTDFAGRALKRIAPIYEDSEFIREFFNGISFDDVRAHVKTLREQRFIETVDWGIEYQEHKYSLEPRPDLDLEQRRERLGIRSQLHRPLNPAILEQAIYRNFGLSTYLYEKDPGFIWLCARYMTEESFQNALDFLLFEKPAHLSLKVLLGMEEYTGGKKEDDDGDSKPRIFAGVATAVVGTAKIEPARPKNQLIRARAGVGQFVTGEAKLLPAALKGAIAFARAGVGINVGGEITVSCQKTLIPHSPNLPVIYPSDSPIIIPPDPVDEPILEPAAEPEVYSYFLENPMAQLAIAGKAVARGVLGFIQPSDEADDYSYFTENPTVQLAIADKTIARGALPNARPNLTE